MYINESLNELYSEGVVICVIGGTVSIKFCWYEIDSKLLACNSKMNHHFMLSVYYFRLGN